jgi:protein JSN1
LKEVFERVFFTEGHESEGSNLDESGARIQQYSAMEVFARNLTAGWWACGNEVLKFNARECWVDEGDS